MSKASLTLAIVFLSFLALSRAADLPENDVSPDSNPTILLPSDAAAVAETDLQPDNEIKPMETATTVTFRPADHMLDGTPKFSDSLRFPFRTHRRPCRHGARRTSKMSDLQAREISYGNDMIVESVEVNADGSVSETGNHDLYLREFRQLLPRRHQHDKPDAEKEDREGDSDSDSDDELDHGIKRFHHGRHHFDRKDAEVEKHDRLGKPEGEEKGQPWKMMRVSHDDEEFDHGMKRFRHGHHHMDFERDDEEHDHHRHHHHEEDGNEEHHHHRHHHHHGENEDEEKGGILSSFRKFLMNPF